MGDKIVTFLMPDGTKVSNDPQFEIEKAQQKALEATPNRGSFGPDADEQKATMSNEQLVAPQSGQPGVGDAATFEDPMDYLPETTGRDVQKEDVEEADAAQGSPKNTSVTDRETVDSNEKVAEVRKSKAQQEQQLKKAQDAVSEPGDPTESYAKWTGKQLKLEALRRNAERENEADQIDLTGVTKKSELVELLDQDDERTASGL